MAETRGGSQKGLKYPKIFRAFGADLPMFFKAYDYKTPFLRLLAPQAKIFSFTTWFRGKKKSDLKIFSDPNLRFGQNKGGSQRVFFSHEILLIRDIISAPALCNVSIRSRFYWD